MSERVWIPDRDWRLLDPWESKSCRRPLCLRLAVAELMRWSHARNKAYPWAYCEAHLYGRQIEAGQVLISVPADSPVAEQGFVGRWQGLTA